MSGDKWSDDTIQFARLLCEIQATQDLDVHSLCDSMDLTPADVQALFARAEAAWSATQLGALEVEHNAVCKLESDHHAIHKCQCKLAAQWWAIKDGQS